MADVQKAAALRQAKAVDAEDGYRNVRAEPNGADILRSELLTLGHGARWFEKSSDWLQASCSFSLQCVVLFVQ